MEQEKSVTIFWAIYKDKSINKKDKTERKWQK